MNLYIEYSNLKKIKRNIKSVSNNVNRQIDKISLIFKKNVCLLPYYYLRKRKFATIEYMIYGDKVGYLIKKSFNKNKKPLELTYIINKKIKNRFRKFIDQSKRIIKIYDNSSDDYNLDIYRQSKYVLYKTKNDNTLLNADLILSSLNFELEYQCKCSSCLGKNLYIDRRGNVSFCIEDIKNTVIGNINEKTDYFKNVLFDNIINEAIENKDNCKVNCDKYDVCRGFCPLDNDCSYIKNNIKKILEDFNMIRNKKSDISNEHYSIQEAIIKDISYKN